MLLMLIPLLLLLGSLLMLISGIMVNWSRKARILLTILSAMGAAFTGFSGGLMVGSSMSDPIAAYCNTTIERLNNALSESQNLTEAMEKFDHPAILSELSAAVFPGSFYQWAPWAGMSLWLLVLCMVLPDPSGKFQQKFLTVFILIVTVISVTATTLGPLPTSVKGNIRRYYTVNERMFDFIQKQSANIQLTNAEISSIMTENLQVKQTLYRWWAGNRELQLLLLPASEHPDANQLDSNLHQK